jgi:hypothetical protein
MRVNHSIAALILFGLVLPPSAHGDKVKGFYAGSTGGTNEYHRVVFIEFAADGSAIVQQTREEKETHTWHARWLKSRNSITLTYDAIKDAPTPAPLVFAFKSGALIPTSWDPSTLGVLGPPKLTPFGGRNSQAGSVSACQSLNTLDPRRDCVTWDSKR